MGGRRVGESAILSHGTCEDCPTILEDFLESYRYLGRPMTFVPIKLALPFEHDISTAQFCASLRNILQPDTRSPDDAAALSLPPARCDLSPVKINIHRV